MPNSGKFLYGWIWQECRNWVRGLGKTGITRGTPAGLGQGMLSNLDKVVEFRVDYRKLLPMFFQEPVCLIVPKVT